AVGFLFLWKRDVQADRSSAGFERALVGGLHDARPAAGDDGIARLRQQPAGLLGGFVVGVARIRPRGAEDRHAALHRRHHLKTLDELRHDAKDPPGILTVWLLDWHYPFSRSAMNGFQD